MIPLPPVITERINRFEQNHHAYHSELYNETQLRREFVDPFFEALGWDVNNKQGYAEAYKDVIHEDAIKVGGVTKAPDYCFRIGGTRKFFIEAKKPSIKIKEDIGAAFQLRRYAWSAKLPLSILTNFEEFAVYDCRIKPDKADKASTARILYLTVEDYVQHWEEMASVFSHEAVLKGSFDKYAEAGKGKKGTAEVDTAFLKEIESWRELLARNLALRNPDLTQRELNFSVQRIIDRIIFLRICEDRGIEDYNRLLSLINGTNVYRRLDHFFRLADERYNSGLFHFSLEKGRNEEPDRLTPGLIIDDAPLKEIIKDLYYPDSPYEFSVLPADILGQVYEQFLGKVIRLTAGHRAVVEDKPEVKKAGGVYYTPTYIVDYIVKNTVGKLVTGKTPNQAAKIRILDPACGSGSFLINAYQYLLDWHLDWYQKNTPRKWTTGRSPILCQGHRGEWKLTTAERKRILLNNIYGVDIDSQAVEVTKLSLLLKVLEGENEQTLSRQLKLFRERALPDLGNNIKCGNSLIGPDYYDAKQLNLFDIEERLRVNVFDWDNEFREIMHAGGFDGIIGNPPYVDIKGLPETDVQYIFSRYHTANNRINLFAAFIEKCLNIVKLPQFRFSMIIPTAFLTQESYLELRRKITNSLRIDSLARLPNESFGSVAGEVKVDTVIIVLSNPETNKAPIEIIGYSGYNRISSIDPLTAQVHSHIYQSNWEQKDDCVWAINATEDDDTILQRCLYNSIPFEECAYFSLGLTPYDKYKGHTVAQIKNRVFHAPIPKNNTYKKILAGNDVKRYSVSWNGEEWISYGSWLGAPRDKRFFVEKRILVKQIIDWTTKRIWATITSMELYNAQNAFNILPKPGWTHEYLLGILNSRLISFYHRKRFLDEFKMRFQKILIKDCKRLPIHVIDFSNPFELALHDQMGDLVERMLSLHQELIDTKTDHERTALKRQIDTTDHQIDRLVYDLYGLTDEEIKIVEEAIS